MQACISLVPSDPSLAILPGCPQDAPYVLEGLAEGWADEEPAVKLVGGLLPWVPGEAQGRAGCVLRPTSAPQPPTHPLPFPFPWPQALLTATLKLFFKRAPECRAALGAVLTSGSADADQEVHDRALLYYRLLQQGVGAAQSVVEVARPVLTAFADPQSAETQAR